MTVAEMGRKGGQSRSAAKVAASRRNGLKRKRESRTLSVVERGSEYAPAQERQKYPKKEVATERERLGTSSRPVPVKAEHEPKDHQHPKE